MAVVEERIHEHGGGLTRRQAVSLAIGSIAGSGILFLPSAVYVEAGRNSLLVWVLSTAACLPMLLMFEDMVRANPGGNGIEAFIRSGLGDVVGRSVPLMFLALVVSGLPAGSLIAARYVVRAMSLPASDGVMFVVALPLLLGALAANLSGVQTNARVQRAGSWALVAMALVLVLWSATRGDSRPPVFVPDIADLHVVLPGLTLAFWAFAGFENLTFLSREFRRPERDFLPVSAIALGIYGLLTILLTVAISLRLPRGRVDQVVGLLQLATTMQPRRVVIAAVVVIAFGTMELNAVAWVWGVSRLVARAASTAILPRAFARTTEFGVPRRAVLFLGGLFTVSLTVLVLIPGILVDAVAATSAIFIVLYVLSIVSYLRVRGVTSRTMVNLLPLLVLAASLVQAGWRAAYGVVVLVLGLVTQVARGRLGGR